MQAEKYVCVFVRQMKGTQSTGKKKKKKMSAQVGREAEEKHQGGQTAMKSLMLPASVEIGPANCPNPEQVLIPPKRGAPLKPLPMSSGIY